MWGVMNMADPSNIEASGVLSETWRILHATSGVVVVYVLGLTAYGVVSDWKDPDGFNGGEGVVTTIAGYYLLTAMLRNSGLLREKSAKGIWSYIGLGILSTLATILGFLLLIVPGVILLVRWLPAYGYLFCDNLPVTDALGKSWDRTRQNFSSLFVASVVPVFGFVAGFAAYVLSDGMSQEVYLSGIVVGNLALSASGAVWTALGVAAYSLLEPPTGHLSDVFE